MTGSRRRAVDFYFRFAVGTLLICALFVRTGVASPLRIHDTRTAVDASRCPLKSRLIDCRTFDCIDTRVFSVLDSPAPAPLIARRPEPVQAIHFSGPYSNRPPPAN